MKLYIDHKTIVRISRILDQMSANVMLLDANGQVILPENEHQKLSLPEAILQNPTKPLVYGGFTLIGTGDMQPIFVCLPGNSEDVQNCAILIAEIINMITQVDINQTSTEQSLRMMLLGEVDGAELESIAVEHCIPAERDRLCMYFFFSDIDAENAMNILTNVIEDNDGDMLTEVGHHAIALIKTIDEGFEYEDVEQLALAVVSSFLTETSHEMIVGIGDVKHYVTELPITYREAKEAINIGKVYHPNQQVFVYRKLLLERFLSKIPEEMGMQYHQQMFNRKNARLFNEEMVKTIEMFFENNLNLSETARQLYIHRNTLVYRLDKVQRIIGLDLRNFDDAVTFKMMLLLGRHIPGSR